MKKKKANHYQVLGKKEITDRIYKRLGKSLSKNDIYSVVSIIAEEISNTLVLNETISIKNFGTFSPFVFHKHDAFDLNSGNLIEVQPFKSVKFHPHVTFKRLLTERRKHFTKTSVNLDDPTNSKKRIG